MGSVSQAYRYCEWITHRHYENFPVASWLLPAELRPHVAAVYAFARSADDFADESRYQGRSLELLEQWRSMLWNAARPSTGSGRAGNGAVRAELVEARTVEHPIFLALADTIRQRDLPVQLLDDLLTAFMMDVTQRRYADWEELMTYCRYSANPVGRLVLLLFGIREEELHRRSDDICTALQLANHWQDLRIDLARDILYIPQDMMRSFGVTEAELRKYGPGTGPAACGCSRRPSSAFGLRAWRRVLPPASPVPGQQFRLLMKELVSRTRALFDSGEPLVRQLKGGLRLEIKLTLLGGRAILDKIEAARYDVFRHRPVISTADKLGLLTRAVF